MTKFKPTEKFIAIANIAANNARGKYRCEEYGNSMNFRNPNNNVSIRGYYNTLKFVATQWPTDAWFKQEWGIVPKLSLIRLENAGLIKKVHQDKPYKVRGYRVTELGIQYITEAQQCFDSSK